ncbi:ankyrin repeat domain-containing protein [Spirillospora sp. NPDC029432]|uniref:ankyrin repeat domain-containing protein n=1 Tax=Spirillospora sp. NPDC029432 TaxID=3154599 RepID=UPI0034539B71
MSGNALRELPNWRRVRRYAVPRWMIEEATERRLAGDWAGACAAARVRVAVDPPSIAREHGAEVAAAVEDDLRHLAPDLLRWHFPRYGSGRSTIAVRHALVLGEYGGVPLHVLTPTMADGPQHLTLRFQPVQDGGEGFTHTVDWSGVRHLWDVRHTAELLERCGGTDRAPFFHPDGTPLAEAELGRSGDAPGRTELTTLLLDRGELEAAFEAAGIELDLTPPDVPSYYNAEPRPVLSGLPLALERIVPEARRIGGDRFQVAGTWRCATLIELGERPRVQVVDTKRAEGAHALPWPVWRRLPDLDLLRTGVIGPDDLHPLVRSALFPAYPYPDRPAGPPAEPAAPEPVRVRCKGEWHEIAVRDGDLRIPHTDEERDREQALEALGGEVTGCFAVHTAWRTSEGRLPRRLREQRQALFLHAQHGDTPAVLHLLDTGAATRFLDGRKRTLLHYLHLLDHEELLPRLLKAGVDLEARDQGGRTPLHMAVGDHGSPELVRALVDAGARLDVVDDMEFGLIDLIKRWKRTDLDWLKVRLEAEHPDAGGGYWSYDEDY